MKGSVEKIRRLVKLSEDDVLELKDWFDMIAKTPSKERPYALETFFEEFGFIASMMKPTPCEYYEAEEGHLMVTLMSTVTNFMHALEQKNLRTADYYRKLWNFIARNPRFPTKPHKVMALWLCAMMGDFPYVRIDRSKALSMDEEAFCRVQEQIGKHALYEMERILDMQFSQNVQQASLLVQRMDALPDYESRCVFMTKLLDRALRRDLHGLAFF